MNQTQYINMVLLWERNSKNKKQKNNSDQSKSNAEGKPASGYQDRISEIFRCPEVDPVQ